MSDDESSSANSSNGRALGLGSRGEAASKEQNDSSAFDDRTEKAQRQCIPA